MSKKPLSTRPIRRACCVVSLALAAAMLSPALAGPASLENLETLKSFEARRASSAHPDWRDNNLDFKHIDPSFK